MISSRIWLPTLHRPPLCPCLIQREKAAARVALPSPLFASSSSNSSCKVTTGQLRSQLDQLRIDAEQTRIKANNARLRLMRLSEVAEKLWRQAAVEIQFGKENEARELLLQKRKVMQALEKSKSRIELLNKLSMKLNEAISVKETQLIANVALDLELSREDASHPVRIVSSKEDAIEDKEAEAFNSSGTNSGEDQELEFQENCQSNVPADCQQENSEGALNTGTLNEDHEMSCLKGISSFEDFLRRLDLQLHEIEAELLTILRHSTLLMENDQKQENFNLQQTLDILENVHHIRARITNIILTKTESR